MGIRFNFSRLEETVSPRFFSLYHNKTRHLHLCGGAGSGKSHFGVQKLLYRIGMAAPHNFRHRFLCVRKTQPAMRRSVFTLIQEKINAWGWWPLFPYVNKTDMTIQGVTGSEIMFVGLDDRRKLQSIERVTGILVEEALELTPKDLLQLDLRLRGEMECYKQIIYQYNPTDMGHDIYRQHYEGLAPDFSEGPSRQPHTYIHLSTVEDNVFIDEEYRRVLDDLKDEDPEYYRIFRLGQWGRISNLIYTNWVQEDRWPTEFEDECYGLDFGYHNPTALVSIGIRDQEPWLRQLIYETHLTNTQVIERMTALGVSKKVPIWADNAEPDRIEEITDAGYDCRPADEAKKPGGVKTRIDFCRSRKIHVHPESVDVVREFKMYKSKLDKNERPMDEPLKFADHAMNAFEYGFYEQFRGMVTPGFFLVGGKK